MFARAGGGARWAQTSRFETSSVWDELPGCELVSDDNQPMNVTRTGTEQSSGHYETYV